MSRYGVELCRECRERWVRVRIWISVRIDSSPETDTTFSMGHSLPSRLLLQLPTFDLDRRL